MQLFGTGRLGIKMRNSKVAVLAMVFVQNGGNSLLQEGEKAAPEISMKEEMEGFEGDIQAQLDELVHDKSNM